MEEGVIAIAGALAGFAIRHYVPRLRGLRCRHQFDTMRSDGRWHCAVCGRAKRKGS